MIKVIDAEKSNPSPEPSGAELVAAVAEPANPVTPADIPLLTLEEKRRILARIARVDPLDCFDESGAFDIARAKRILPPGAVRYISVHETIHLNAEGQPVTERRINVRLVDPVSALRLDDLIERRRERTASSSPSDSSPKTFSRRDFNRLKEKTMALDDANQSIALLKKALAEMDDRELQLSKELEEKDRQLSQTLSLSNGAQTQSKDEGDAAQRSSTALQSRDHEPEFVGQALRLPAFPNTPDSGTASGAENLSPNNPSLPSRDEAQRDTGCQPVDSNDQTPSSKTLSSAKESKPLSNVKGPHPSGVTRLEALTKLENPTPAELKEMEALCFLQEAEEVKNSSGPGAFADWLRARGIDPATYRSPPPGYLPTVKIQMARPSPRPPPKYDPMSFSAQCVAKDVE